MAAKVYFGVPGYVQEIPAPESGMGFLSDSDYESTALVSGGRSVWRAPTAYKTFNVSWRGGSQKLGHLIDCYNGQFGQGPFYLTDPTVSQFNVLPARWANSWQLAHQANGWGRPVVIEQPIPVTSDPKVARVNKYVKFTQAASGSTIPTDGVVKIRTIRVPGEEYYLSVNGSATGGAGIKVRACGDGSNMAWNDLGTLTDLTGTPQRFVYTSDNYTMIELSLYLPLGSTLTLKGMALSTTNLIRPGKVLRTNYATNPRAISPGTGFAAYTAGTGEAGTTTWVTGASDGPVGGPSSYGRWSVTTAKTGGSTGWNAQGSSYRAAKSGTAGSAETISLWVRYTGSGTLTGVLRGTAYSSGGSNMGTADSAPYVLQSGVWTRTSVTLTATSGFSSLGWWFFQTSGSTAPAGSTIDVTGVLSGASGNYFDGATSGSSSSGYNYWTGTPDASTSVNTDTAAGGSLPRGRGTGALQFANTMQGELVSSVIDRIGLSVDLQEVQSVESR